MATLQQLIDYSRKNPTSDIAKKTRRAIESGAYDQEATQSGVDLSWAGRPAQKSVTPTVAETTPKVAPNGTKPELKQTALEGIIQEEIAGAGEKFTKTISEAPGVTGKTAAILGLPLRAAATTARIGGRALAEPLMKLATFIGSPIVEKIDQVVPGFSEEVASNVGGAVDVISQKADQIKQAVGEETYQALIDSAEVLSTFYGGRAATAPLKKAAQESFEAGTMAGRELAEAGARIAKSGKEMAETGVRKVGEKVAEKGGGVSESLVANINRINPSKRQQFQVQQGIPEEKWLIDRGIIGTREKTVKELANRFQTIKQNVDEALDAIPGNYRDPRVTTVANDAAAFAKSVESKEAGRMAQLAEKASGEGLTTREINEVKRFYERNIKTGYKQDPTKTAEQVQRATNRDSDIREALFEIADENGFGNLRELNKEIQASKFLADEIAGKMQGQAANNLMTLTDWIVATPGVVDPSFFSGFVGKKLLSTETVRALAARALAGFPKVKPLPRADLDLITRKASELLKRQADIKVETQKAALLADELQKAGFTMSGGAKGFIIENPIPLSRNEQALIRAAKNRAEQQQMVNYILEQRAQGKAVGKNFVIEDIDNVPILNPSERFDPKLGLSIEDVSKKKLSKLDPLTLEARKYKSAEEFVSIPGIKPENIRKMTLFGSQAEGKATAKSDIDILVSVVNGPMRPKIINKGKLSYMVADESYANELLKVVRKEGVMMKDNEGITKTLTKSQLTDIWNKATGKTKK